MVTTTDTLSYSRLSPTLFARFAAGALVVLQIVFQVFALWHGALDTPDATTTYAVVAANRNGWYMLHYGTVFCLAGIAVAIVGLLTWFTVPRARLWSIIATVLVLLGALHMAIAFGAEAIGYFYATDPAVLPQQMGIGYLQAWLDGGHYGLLVATGVLGYLLGEAAAISVFYRQPAFPLALRRLLIVAVICELVKLFVPFLPSAVLSVAAAAIWAAFGVVALRQIGRADVAPQVAALQPQS